jgi:hypothetical protein
MANGPYSIPGSRFPLLHRVQTKSEEYTTSYAMGIAVSFAGDKAVEA